MEFLNPLPSSLLTVVGFLPPSNIFDKDLLSSLPVLDFKARVHA